MAEILITVAEGGKTAIEVNGAKGKQCETLTAGLEKAFGTVTEKKHKPEYHQHAAQPKAAQQGQ